MKCFHWGRLLLTPSSRIIEHPILGFVRFSGSSEAGLTALSFHPNKPMELPSEDPFLMDVERMLQQYLLGETVDFTEIPLAPVGTPFQQSVWNTLCSIPWGETRSYKWVAEQVGNPNGMRAVGQANGRNPIPIIIPCHRVVQHNGGLGGYSGGLYIKNFLLSLEQNQPQANQLVLSDYLRPTKAQAMTLL
jgi:O-6-methylguanine DNA methyltransferase